jgi:hypothetical protein
MIKRESNMENKMEVTKNLKESKEKAKEMLEAIKILGKMKRMANKNKTVKRLADKEIFDLKEEVYEEKEYQKELMKVLKRGSKK